MSRFLKQRAAPLLLLAALTAGLLIFAGRTGSDLPALQSISSLGQEAAEAALLGTPRQEVLSAWGEPDGMLSGFFGDIYALSSTVQVIVYYDTSRMSQGAADSLTVPVQHILIADSEKEETP